MQWMLLLDTCGDGGGVAVARLPTADGYGEPHIIAERALPSRGTQEELLPAIAEVLEAGSLRPQDLHVLAVVTGPGSFTGIRIGMAAAKGLAEALGLPVVAVSRLAVLAAQAAGDGPVQAWIDAGRGDLFVGRYEGSATNRECMMHGSDAMAQMVEGLNVVVMEERLANQHPFARRVPEVGVRNMLHLAAAAVREEKFVDVNLLDANYLRVPDAELARNAAVAASGR